MQELTRLWHTLDNASALAGVEAQWRDWLGDELDLVRGFLRPEQEQARSYPCDSPGGVGCPRRVVVHGEDDIVAVCGCSPAECEPIKLGAADVIVHRLDEVKFGKAVARALGLKPARGSDVDLPGVTTTGVIDVVFGRRAPVYLVLQTSADDERHVVERLLAASRKSPPLLAVPVEPPLDLRGQIEDAGGAVIVCADLVMWEANALVPMEAAQSVVDAARARMAQWVAATASVVREAAAPAYVTKTQTFNDTEVSNVCKMLRDANNLKPITGASLSGDVVAVGMLNRRGKRVPVVWMPKEPSALDETCRGVQQKLGAESLIVLLEGGTAPTLVESGAALLGRGDDDDLQLWRALDLLDPGYRDERIKSKMAIFDDVTIEFAHVPGDRHVVLLNGEPLKTFAKSDKKFLSLLCIAAERKAGMDIDDGGWFDKSKLGGDDKDHDVGELRGALVAKPHSLAKEERRALIKSSPRKNGTIRLALDPRNVRFDESLAAFEFLSDRQNGAKKKSTPGAKQYAEHMRQARREAKRLLRLAKKLGVDVLPGEGGVEPKRTRRRGPTPPLNPPSPQTAE